jgi:hypothetical protein
MNLLDIRVPTEAIEATEVVTELSASAMAKGITRDAIALRLQTMEFHLASIKLEHLGYTLFDLFDRAIHKQVDGTRVDLAKQVSRGGLVQAGTVSNDPELSPETKAIQDHLDLLYQYMQAIIDLREATEAAGAARRR